MSLDRSARSILASLFLLAALFLAMSRIVTGAPLADWLLPLVLFILGVAFIPDWDLSRVRLPRQASTPPSNVQAYSVSTQTTPRPHTMTIRPDPESPEYHASTTVTVTKEQPRDEVIPFDEAPAASEPLPFIEAPSAAPPLSPDSEAPASPETPAPVIAAEPEPEAEPVPVSPETPAPNAPEEPVVASPETPAPEGGDSLTRLSGIGQKSAAALAAAGIDTYQKLADSNEESIRAALADGGVRMVGNVNHSLWIQQAAYAARGDWDGLAKFNAERKSPTED
jgi:predicted flap endonuclease-1-like 5' DNA nuclease